MGDTSVTATTVHPANPPGSGCGCRGSVHSKDPPNPPGSGCGWEAVYTVQDPPSPPGSGCGCRDSVHSTGLTQSTWVRVWVQRYCTHYRINLIHLVRVWGVEMLYTQHRIHSLHLSEVVYTIQVGVGVHSV